MSQFKAEVGICLKGGNVKFVINLNAEKDVEVELNNHITYIDSKGIKHVVLFIATNDGSEIGVSGKFSKQIERAFINKDLRINEYVEVILFNDNEIYDNGRKGKDLGEEPKEAGNGGVVGVTECP